MLKFEHSLPSRPVDGTRVRRVMLERGFREMKSDGSRLRFQRGSAFAMMFTFSPAKWRMDVSVDTAMGNIQVDVHTTGQIVTKTERAYFDVLFSDISGALTDRKLLPGSAPTSELMRTSKALEKSAIMINVRLAIGTSVLSGFGTLAVVAFLFGNSVLAFVMLTVGVVLTVYAVAGRGTVDKVLSDSDL